MGKHYLFSRNLDLNIYMSLKCFAVSYYTAVSSKLGRSSKLVESWEAEQLLIFFRVQSFVAYL